MSGLSGDVKRGAMKAMGFCVLPVLLSMAAPGGISDALSASGQPLPKTPVSPSSAATLPLPDPPAGGAARDLPPAVRGTRTQRLCRRQRQRQRATTPAWRKLLRLAQHGSYPTREYLLTPGVQAPPDTHPSRV